MTKTFHTPSVDLRKLGCPQGVIDNALATNREVLQLIWDGADYPEQSHGFVQWSVRPFLVTDRCDGTRDANVMAVLRAMCGYTDVNLSAIYQSAYPDDENIFARPEYLDYLDELLDECEIPSISEDNLLNLLNSLYSMNWRSLTSCLAETWSEKWPRCGNFWCYDIPTVSLDH